MTTFEPRQTRDWSTRELDALIGKQVRIVAAQTDVSGVVADANIGLHGYVFIEWVGGGAVTWHRDTDPATITVETTGGQP